MTYSTFRKIACFTLVVLPTLALSAFAQTSDANPGHSPDVFLDNHRSLNPKKQKAPTARTVTGKVVDDTGQPLEGAVVTLTDTKSKEKTQTITKKDGRYNFEDVSFTVDYELQARYKDQQSDQRKLSQYDHRASVVRILQVGSALEPTAATTAPAGEPKKPDAPPQNH